MAQMIEEQELLNQYFKREVLKLNKVVEEQTEALNNLTLVIESLIDKVTKLEISKAIDDTLKTTNN